MSSYKQSILFYYEVYEYEFDDDSETWTVFSPEPSFVTEVQTPAHKNLEGFDVTTFFAHTSPEHSPLSCNSLATNIPVNEHCLFRTFEEAKEAIEGGLFKNSEPGPYRIFAVYTVLWACFFARHQHHGVFLGAKTRPLNYGRFGLINILSPS